MVFDGYWKRELKKQLKTILRWRLLGLFYDYSKHQLTRALLYSATIIRKVIEEEIEVNVITKELKNPPELCTIDFSISATKYLFVGKNGTTIRGKMFPEDYGKGQQVELKAKDVCNWLLHSYVWGIAQHQTKEQHIGFMIASDFDKEKFLHYISFDEWIRLINCVLENSIMRPKVEIYILNL